MKKQFWLAALAYLLPTFPLGYAWHLVIFTKRTNVLPCIGLRSSSLSDSLRCSSRRYSSRGPIQAFSTRREDWLASAAKFALLFGTLTWSFTTLSVAAKNNMTSVADFLKLETAFTAVQFVVIAPLIALAYRGAQSTALAGGKFSAA